ncbi:MAG: helix-turn-helix domain-containing protein [Flavobacteriaceae bacterium]|nr:helix-turn-helix domain-containing protein [Flavobacteriaceae bacterium]
MILNINLGQFNASTFSLKEYCNESVKIAALDLYHIVFLKSNCICHVNFKQYTVSENSILFLSSRDVFSCKMQNQKLWTLSFDKDIFQNECCDTESIINGLLFNNIFDQFFLNPQTNRAHEIQLKLTRIINHLENLDYETSTTLFKEILFYGINTKHKLVMSENKSVINYKKVYQYLSLICEHFRMEHNVSVYAGILEMQPKMLSKTFHDLKLDTPKYFLNQRIILAAKKLLVFTSSTVINISYDIGLNEPAYFSRFFKRNVGLSAKQFRSLHNEFN